MVGGESTLLGGLASCARKTRIGESIARRPRRPRRGIGLVTKVFAVADWLTCEKDANRGKHRTEDTEATEGDGLVAKVFCWTWWLTCEKDANRGKHRTEDTEVTEWGLGWWRKSFAGGWLTGEKDANRGKHRTEAQRSRRGIGLVAKVFCWARWLTCEKDANRGKHRTEVTEATEGDWVGGESLLLDAVAHVRERRESGKASHGGHGGHGGGLGWWRKVFCVGEVGLTWRERARIGESIARRTRRSRRGIGLVAKIFSRRHVAHVRRTVRRREKSGREELI